jgi:uncharacterized protein YxeA
MKKTVIIIMSVLTIIIAVTAYMNKDYAEKRAEIENKAAFVIKNNGTVVSTMYLERY